MSAQTLELSGSVSGEFRGFLQSPLLDEQHGSNLSAAVKPELYYEWADGDHSILVIPFLRLDSGDSERTHLDVREAFWWGVFGDWEVRAGLQKVFWGVTESQHLVDVLNQTDLVENLDREDKLGQPMIAVTWVQPWGVLDGYLLPGFRPRTFPGADGRFRPHPPMDTERELYESDAGSEHLDWAVRWSNTLGFSDIGVAHFSGTGRDPGFVPGTRNGEPVLVPFYPQVTQTSLDYQLTYEGWLGKLETVYRSGRNGSDSWGLVGGFEYTFGTVLGSNVDVGVLGEYHYDDRGPLGATPFDDDLFLGTRLAFNDVQDTQLLTGMIVDRDTRAAFWTLEASRRIGDRWRLEVEVRTISGAAPSDPLFGLRKDDYIQIDLARYF